MTPNVTDIKRTTFWKIGGTQNVPSGKLHEIKGKKKYQLANWDSCKETSRGLGPWRWERTPEKKETVIHSKTQA